MRVLFVRIADARKEASRLDAEAIAQADGLDVRLLDADLVGRRDRGEEGAANMGIDVGGNRQLRLAQVPGAGLGIEFAAGRQQALDAALASGRAGRVLARILRCIVVHTGKDQRDLGIEGAGGGRLATCLARNPGLAGGALGL